METRMVNEYIVNKYFLIKLINLFLALTLSVITFYDESFGCWFLVYGLLLNFGIIYQVRNSQLLILLMFYVSTYLLYLIPIYFLEKQIGYVVSYHTFHLFNQVLIIHVLFLSLFSFFIRNNYNQNKMKLVDLIPIKNNPVIFNFLVVIMIILIFHVKGVNIFSGKDGSYSLYRENLSNVSGLWEYFYLLFISTFLFTKSKLQKWILLLIGIIYMAKSLLLGLRVQLLQMVIICFVLFFENKLKLKYLIMFLVLGIFSMETYGIMKEVGFSNFMTVMGRIDQINSDNVMLTNQTEVFYSSATYLGVIDDGTLSIDGRIKSTIGFMQNLIIPSAYVIEEGRLPSFISKYTHLGGGGLISIQFYVWFSWLGIIMLAFILAYFFNKLYSNKNIAYIGILVIGTFPRWFAYDPGNFLFRLPLYLFIIYLFIMEINKRLKIKLSE
jgi:hypothetical protein